MNILGFESLRTELLEKTFNTSSAYLRLSAYLPYFEKILLTDNKSFEEAFLTEFLDDYLECVKRFSVFGTDPLVTEQLVQQLLFLKERNAENSYGSHLQSELKRIKNLAEQLNAVLGGKESSEIKNPKVFFPLIDITATNGFYGIIDSITIHIRKTENSDKFLLVPAERDSDKRIEEQLRKSWLAAKGVAKHYIKKMYEYHEVMISFEQKDGYYAGNSLGISLTLSFVEELLRYYNPTFIISIKKDCAFTGGIDQTGNVIKTSEEIIRQKVKTIFFSNISTFILPKADENYAQTEMNKLKEIYPARELKLAAVEVLDDVLNRRDLVEIKKQKITIRTTKFVKKNWLSAAATVLLAVLFAFLYVLDWDDNPTSIIADENHVYVKNNSGRVLWSKKIRISNTALSNDRILSGLFRVLDMDGDGINEILTTAELPDEAAAEYTGSHLVCLNNDGTFKWIYKFEDFVESKREKLKPFYNLVILDTLTLFNKKRLIMIGNNDNSFSSVIFGIDLIKGSRMPGTFWGSGHIISGLVKDINQDNVSDLIYLGVDNGFEQQVLFGFDIDTLTTVRLSTSDYTIKNFPIQEPIAYLRFPKTDYDNYMNVRIPAAVPGSFYFDQDERKYQFICTTDHTTQIVNPWVKIDEDFREVEFIIDNRLRVIRDTLVAQGILTPPYTDTEEYKNIYKDNVLYWEKNNWVNRKEME